MDAQPVMMRPSYPRPTHRPDMFRPCGCSTKYRVPLERIDHARRLIYQHRTSEQDRLIAEAVSKLTEQELSRLTGSSGTQRARH